MHKLLNYIRLRIKERVAEDHNLELLKWDNLTEEIKSRIFEIEEIMGQEIDKEGDILLQLDIYLDAVSSMFEESGTDRLAFLRHYIYDEADFVFNKEYFDREVKIPFESGIINAPNGFDEVMKINYGANYIMPAKAGVHEYPYYKKWEYWIRDYVQKNPELGEIMSPYYYPDI